MCRHLSLKGNGVSDRVFRVISTPKGFPIEKVPRSTLKRKPKNSSLRIYLITKSWPTGKHMATSRLEIRQVCAFKSSYL